MLSDRVFAFVESRRQRWGVFALVMMAVVLLGVGLARIQKDTSLDAFVPVDSPALVARDKAARTFGLTEPIVVALVGSEPGRAMQADALRELRFVTELLAQAPGVDREQVNSLSTRPWVSAEGDALNINRILPEGAIGSDSAGQVERALLAVPAASGILVSDDRSSVMIAAEMSDTHRAGEAYAQIRSALDARPQLPGIEVHVAGQATISGFLSDYIDQDTRRVMPVGIALIVVLMAVLLRRPSAALVGVFVILSTVVSTIGLMGWLGAPIYVITSTLPIVLVCVSVADTIHLVARTQSAQQSGAEAPLAMRRSLQALLMPLTLTSLTTAFGFLGVAFGSELPAFQQYGLFAAVGIVVAWAVTLFAAPAIYLALPQKRAAARPLSTPWRIWPKLARAPQLSLMIAAVLASIGLYGFSQLEFNYQRVENFAERSPVFLADLAINSTFDGSHYLDVMITAEEGGDLLDPEVIRAIDELQQWMRSEQSGFSDSFSYVDVLKDTRKAVDPSTPNEQLLPLTREDAAQLLFLFEISGKPGDLAQQITQDHQVAYVRGFLRSDNFKQSQEVETRLQSQIDERLSRPGIAVELTGPIFVANSWIGPLLPNTQMGILLALVLVWLTSTLLFRSIRSGVLCLLPVILAVVLVLGVMGLSGIWLSVTTSMFVAISIGLGVDFGIHMLHALRKAQAQGLQGPAMAELALTEVGPPLTINAVSLTVGFSAVIFSVIPPVLHFGILMSTASFVAYLSSLMILPAIFQLADRGNGPAAELSREGSALEGG